MMLPEHCLISQLRVTLGCSSVKNKQPTNCSEITIAHRPTIDNRPTWDNKNTNKREFGVVAMGITGPEDHIPVIQS